MAVKQMKKKAKVRKAKKKQKVSFHDVEDDVVALLNKALKEKRVRTA